MKPRTSAGGRRGGLGRTASALVLLAAGLTVAVVLAEVAAAVMSARRCGGGRIPLWRPDREVGWALVPGARAEVPVCEEDRVVARHAVTINALGQRDRPRSLARQRERARVLVLGDSFVEALQVDLEQTFTARLEARLGVEVLNAGVSGYATDNMLRAFQASGRRYAPDVVLLVLFVGNDVMENGARLYLANPHGLPPKSWLSADAPAPSLAACLSVHRGGALLAAATPAAVWRHSRLVRAALTSGLEGALRIACQAAVGPPLIAGVPELLGVYGEPETPAWREAWETTERLLVSLDSAVTAAGARFAVALAPAGLEYDPEMRWFLRLQPEVMGRAWDFDYPHRRLAAALDRERIRWTSLRPALAEHYRRTGRSGCYPVDAHWDAEGHAVVAEALGPLVTELVAAERPPAHLLQ